MMGFEQAAAQREMLRQPGAGAVGMQQQQFRQAAGALLEGRQVQRRAAAAAGRRAPAGRCGRPGAGIDASRRCRAHRRDRTRRHAPASKLLNHSALCSPAVTSSTAAREPISASALARRWAIGALSRSVLQRHDGEGLGPGAVAGAAAWWRPSAASPASASDSSSPGDGARSAPRSLAG